ncbi:hypothetical protein [Kitasatospora sp. NPDC057015]|uniref:hypothetical protein n=1 Tax=Kitasatospora sp. NPDC057015 TaxID=3346001 RepID=UPI003632DF75
MVGCETSGRAVACHDLGTIGDRTDRQVHPGGGSGPGSRPAVAAAKAVACLALLLAVPITGDVTGSITGTGTGTGTGDADGAGRGGPTGWPAPAGGTAAAHRVTGGYTDPAGGTPAGDSGDVTRPAGPSELRFAAPATTPGYRGLGTLTAQRSGLRLEASEARGTQEIGATREFAVGPDAEREPGRRGVVSRPAATTGDAQQWILRPAAGGEVVLQSVASAGSDGAGVLTAGSGGAVLLRHDRSPAGWEDTGQLWILTDRTAAALRPDPVTGRWATAFRIRAYRPGGCLLDGGVDRSPAVGPCADARAWWTAQGFYG